DPAVAALVALLLLGEALLEEAAELGRIERLEHGPLLVGEEREPRRIGEPALDLVGDHEAEALDALEGGPEGLVEGVELGLGVHEERARDVVEALEGALVHASH